MCLWTNTGRTVKLFQNLGKTPFTDSHTHVYTHAFTTLFGIRGYWETLIICIVYFINFFTVMTQNYLGTAATSSNATAFHWER